MGRVNEFIILTLCIGLAVVIVVRTIKSSNNNKDDKDKK